MPSISSSPSSSSSLPPWMVGIKPLLPALVQCFVYPYISLTIRTDIFLATEFIKEFYLFYCLSGLEMDVVEDAHLELITHKCWYIYVLFTYITFHWPVEVIFENNCILTFWLFKYVETTSTICTAWFSCAYGFNNLGGGDADEMAHNTVTDILLERKDWVQSCQIRIALSVRMILCPMPLSVCCPGCFSRTRSRSRILGLRRRGSRSMRSSTEPPSP